MQRNLANWERVASVAIGSALVAPAIRRKRYFGTAGSTGLMLSARGAGGSCPVSQATGLMSRRDDTRAALGGPGGLSLQQRVIIARPPAEVFAFWRDLENLPRFVSGLERVERLEDDVTRWTFRGPAGVPLQWEAQIINEIEPDLIAWQSLPGADVVSAGSVHFKPTRGGTELMVHLQYDPPGGKIGAAVSWMAGHAPAAELRGDLQRLKQLLEGGSMTMAPHMVRTRGGLFRRVRRAFA